MEITQATLSGCLGRPISEQEVRFLQEDTAREIYTQRYLAAPRIDTLPVAIVPFIFDAAVNHGPRNAIRMVQRVMNEAGFGPVSVDGVIGPKTRKVCEEAYQEMADYFLAALVIERRYVYERIVANNPSQQVFLAGWFNRLAEFDKKKEEHLA